MAMNFKSGGLSDQLASTRAGFANRFAESSANFSPTNSGLAQAQQASRQGFASRFAETADKFSPKNSAIAAANRGSQERFAAAIDDTGSQFRNENSLVGRSNEASRLTGRESRGDFTRTADRGPQTGANLKSVSTSGFEPSVAQVSNAPDTQDRATREAQQRFFGKQRNDPTASAFREKFFRGAFSESFKADPADRPSGVSGTRTPAVQARGRGGRPPSSSRGPSGSDRSPNLALVAPPRPGGRTRQDFERDREFA